MPSRHSKVRFRPGELRIALLELIDRAQRLQVVLEAAVVAHAVVERILPGMTEGRVAEIVRQRDRFGQCLIQRQRAGDRAGDLRHLDRVRHPRAVQIAFVIDEHLGLVGQAAKGIGMDDAIAVALEFAAILRRRLGDSGGRATAGRAPRRAPGPRWLMTRHGAGCAEMRGQRAAAAPRRDSPPVMTARPMPRSSTSRTRPDLTFLSMRM